MSEETPCSRPEWSQ